MFQTARDYSASNQWNWTPAESEGLYEVEVSARNRITGSIASATMPVTVLPRATTTPVVTATAHPLVALYSAPPCAAGAVMRVRFRPMLEESWQATAPKSCNGLRTMNFYVAGMRERTTYEIRHEVFGAAGGVSGPTVAFTTGASQFANPGVTVRMPPAGPESVTFFAALSLSPQTFAVDAAGRLIWYSPVPGTYATRVVPGGSYLQIFGFGQDLTASGFQEVDLAGNILKETNVERLNDQLLARGVAPITAVHHEVRKLDNGGYLVLTMSERMSTAQGGTLKDIVGDTILVLDRDLQVQWAWDSFHHLDVSRAALGGQTCSNGSGLCVLFLADVAQDWTHGNSLALTPDGNIILSARHQDFVYKIHYANGAGDGRVLWKLGRGGDFVWLSSDSYPWFSHQHDAQFDAPSILTLFDNGNLRVNQYGGNSRGQVLFIDETARTVTPLVNADLGSYSFALGSAQRLANGNYAFDSGSVGLNRTEVVEIAPGSNAVSLIEAPGMVYRAFRLHGLSGYSADAHPACAGAQISASTVPASEAGLRSRVGLATGSPCTWTTASAAPWVHVFPPAGAGPAGIDLTIYPNFSTRSRIGLVSIAGQALAVQQAPRLGTFEQRFVELLYFAFLGRLPSPAETEFQLNALRRGLTREQLATNFFQSAEFIAGGRLVAGAYVGLLGRDPEYTGWLFQRNALATGAVTQPQLLANILSSEEYRLRFGSPAPSAFVELLYRYVLGREASPAEVAGQLAAMGPDSPAARAQLAASFLSSTEFTMVAAPRLTAFLLYGTLLQRDATALERAQRESALQAGVAVETLIAEFVRSAEFLASIQ